MSSKEKESEKRDGTLLCDKNKNKIKTENNKRYVYTHTQYSDRRPRILQFIRHTRSENEMAFYRQDMNTLEYSCFTLTRNIRESN